nr:response regulator [Deltaproteobacteria bacterium]
MTDAPLKKESVVPKSVFVIDDSATMRKVFEMTFAGEDIAVVTHDSADGAVARARELRPNAIIVDVNLPGTSSYDLVKSLRGEPNLSSVPVYLLYSDHSPLDEAAARAAGAQGPFARGGRGGGGGPGGGAPPGGGGAFPGGGPAGGARGGPPGPGAVLKPFDSQAMIDRVRQSVSGATATAAAAAAPARPAAPPMPPGAPKLPTAAPVAVARPAPAAPMAPAAPSIRPATPPATPVRPARVTPDDLLPELNEAPRVSARPEPIAAPTPVIPVQASDLAKSVADQVAAKTASLGLTPQQAEAITALTREVVERVVWEVVPVLAETMIREELKRLTSP